MGQVRRLRMMSQEPGRAAACARRRDGFGAAVPFSPPCGADSTLPAGLFSSASCLSLAPRARPAARSPEATPQHPARHPDLLPPGPPRVGGVPAGLGARPPVAWPRGRVGAPQGYLARAGATAASWGNALISVPFRSPRFLGGQAWVGCAPGCVRGAGAWRALLPLGHLEGRMWVERGASSAGPLPGPQVSHLRPGRSRGLGRWAWRAEARRPWSLPGASGLSGPAVLWSTGRQAGSRGAGEAGPQLAVPPRWPLPSSRSCGVSTERAVAGACCFALLSLGRVTGTPLAESEAPASLDLRVVRSSPAPGVDVT